jgi:chemotaxis protein methyltransferase CheR
MEVAKEILIFFSKVIEQKLGIVYSEMNHFQLAARLEELSQKLGHENVEAFYEASRDKLSLEAEQLLVDTSTNNETFFFRDSKLFTAFAEVIEERLNSDSSPLRFWSAASSTGQEALSISLTMLELMKAKSIQADYKIIGTDISQRALDKARSGLYNDHEVGRGLDPELKESYFNKMKDGSWKACDQLMNSVSYSKLNLIESYPFTEKFDVVFCRNVLIYQSVQGKIEILDKIYELIADNGILVLGSGESLFGLTKKFKQFEVEKTILYRKV